MSWLSSQRNARSLLDPAWLEHRALQLSGQPAFCNTEFRVPLVQLTKSLRNEAHLNALGRFHASRNLLRQLLTRVCLEQRWQAGAPGPHDLLKPDRPPIFIVGLHRTGTTLLQHLMAADPAARPLTYWESSYPIAAVHHNRLETSAEARHQRAVGSLGAVKKLAPYLAGIHATEVDGPEECYWLLMSSLVTPAYCMQWHVPTYREWLDTQKEVDWEVAYSHYLALLHQLSGPLPNRHWILKCPLHAARIHTLASLLPEAIFVQTFRDIRQSTGSLCSLTAALQAIGSDCWRPEAVGREVLSSLRIPALRAAEAATVHSGRVIDVHYQQLVADPVGTVQEIYAHAGLDWTSAAKTAIRQQANVRPPRRPGGHTYTLADFGLTDDDVLTACPEYVAREQQLAAPSRHS